MTDTLAALHSLDKIDQATVEKVSIALAQALAIRAQRDPAFKQVTDGAMLRLQATYLNG